MLHEHFTVNDCGSIKNKFFEELYGENGNLKLCDLDCRPRNAAAGVFSLSVIQTSTVHIRLLSVGKLSRITHTFCSAN